jgi:small subunit ribosomal protein S19e
MVKSNPVYEMNPEEYNKKLADLLKEMPEFERPQWSFFVKSGPAKVRPPQDTDFWHRRAASILRQIYTHKVVGVNRLKTRYGSLKNRGMQPEHFVRASGKIIRTILQQAEKAGLLEKSFEKGKRAGRVLTEKGTELLEGIK